MAFNIKQIETIENRHKNKIYNNIEIIKFSHYKDTSTIFKKSGKYKRVAIYDCKCYCGKIFQNTIKAIKNNI